MERMSLVRYIIFECKVSFDDASVTAMCVGSAITDELLACGC